MPGMTDALGQAIAGVARNHSVVQSLPVNIAADLATGGLKSPLTSLSQFNNLLDSAVAPDSPFKGITNAIQAATDRFGAAGPGKHVLFNMYRRKDPLYTYCWFCEMPVVNGYKLDWNYVEEFTAPFRSFDVANQYRQGRVLHFAGQHSISNLTLRFYDDTSGTVGAYLENWRSSVMTPNGVYKYPYGVDGYKKDIKLVVLDITRFIQVYTMTYKGCWPSTADPYNMVSNASERIITSQEFSVDNIEMSVHNLQVTGLANMVYSSLKGNFPEDLVASLSGTALSTGGIDGVFSTDQSTNTPNSV